MPANAKLRTSASAPWRFASYGRGSVEAADSTEPRASASGQTLYADFSNLALRRLSFFLGFELLSGNLNYREAVGGQCDAESPIDYRDLLGIGRRSGLAENQLLFARG